jgi:hypothetical protein
MYVFKQVIPLEGGNLKQNQDWGEALHHVLMQFMLSYNTFKPHLLNTFDIISIIRLLYLIFPSFLHILQLFKQISNPYTFSKRTNMLFTHA